MAKRGEGRRAAIGCCLLVVLVIAVPLAAVAVAAWFLFRARRRISNTVRDRLGIELPEKWLTSLPSAAYNAYRELMAELDDERRERDG